ncbi:MAG: M14 family zinc carboxypeptidase [Huintestinicola sp.]|uniref:M14 family zinc carboxypeptidase n=1 Tax=Huintestinicola sp. TaxID=2981661 RepID=UPI003EFCE082
MGNFFRKAAVTALAVLAVMSAGCYAYCYGGVWGNTGNILEDEEVSDETEAVVSETEPAFTEETGGNTQPDAPASPWSSPAGNTADNPDADEEKQTSENKLSQSGKKKSEKIVDNTDSKYSYNDMREDIDKLIAAYPKLVRTEVIGTTADKRKIYDIIIGNDKADKQIVIQAGCHGREYMTCLLVMDMTEYYLNGYNRITYKDRLLSDYLEDFQVHIVPMLNPDGVTVSQLGAKGLKNPQLRKNVAAMYRNAVAYGYTDLPEARYYERWKANAHGVDINCNFNGKWGMAEELKCPTGWGYKGTSPESEAESRAITKLIGSLSDPVTVISYHASGSVVWWDYAQQGNFRSRCYAEAKLISDMTGYKLNPYDKTSCAGLCDRIIARGGGKTVPILIEIGQGECPLDISEYPEIFRKNYRLLPALMNLYG